MGGCQKSHLESWTQPQHLWWWNIKNHHERNTCRCREHHLVPCNVGEGWKITPPMLLLLHPRYGQQWFEMWQYHKDLEPQLNTIDLYVEEGKEGTMCYESFVGVWVVLLPTHHAQHQMPSHAATHCQYNKEFHWALVMLCRGHSTIVSWCQRFHAMKFPRAVLDLLPTSTDLT